MKISLGFNFQDGPWGGGNQFGKALANGLQQRGYTVINHLNDPDIDIIFLADPRSDLKISAFNHFDILHYRRRINPRAIAVYRVSDCDERKGEQDQFNPIARQAVKAVDVVIWASGWLRDLHLAQGMQPLHEEFLYNGADQSIFHSKGYRAWDGKEPLKLITHHWGGLWQKGFDIYQQLDDLLVHPDYQGRIEFTYVGNVPDGFTFKHAHHIPPTSGHDLADILRAHHVYVTGAQNEPGGNHHMEGANCGLPILYRESGGLPEYCAEFGIGFTAETFQNALDAMLRQYEDILPALARYPFTQQNMIDAYISAFETWHHKITPRQYKTRENDDVAWLKSLRDSLLAYLASLNIDGQIGRYRLANEKPAPFGWKIELPFSTWALKLRYILKDDPPADQLAEWIAYLHSFQSPQHQHAFVDPVIYEGIQRSISKREKLLYQMGWGQSPLEKALSAETKQVIATLAEYKQATPTPYRGFPRHVTRYLKKLNWENPWSAGAHTATLAVFYRTEAPRLYSDNTTRQAIRDINRVIESYHDVATGAYYTGKTPAYGELVNGAMKVLTALDWLETPIHSPETLIDTVLRQKPSSEGCHLVDAVYVLYRCCQQTDYRRDDVNQYLHAIIPMMRDHFNPLDGGFSYHTSPSELSVHKLRVNYAHAASDLHGTLLLTWAGSLMLDLLDQAESWRIIRP